MVAGGGGETRIRGRSGLDLAFAAAVPRQEKVTFGVRPEHLRIADPTSAMLTGEVQIAEHLGGETFLYVSLPSGETIVVEIKGQAAVRSGERVGIDVAASACHVFGGDGLVIGGGAELPISAARGEQAPAQAAPL